MGGLGGGELVGDAGGPAPRDDDQPPTPLKLSPEDSPPPLYNHQPNNGGLPAAAAAAGPGTGSGNTPGSQFTHEKSNNNVSQVSEYQVCFVSCSSSS